MANEFCPNTRSTPNECVGLYCSQLLDLATTDNALAPVATSK